MKIISVLSICILFIACNEKKEILKEPLNNPTQQAFQLPDLPAKMYFGGKIIYLEDQDIRERLDREVLTNVYLQSATSQIIKRAHRWFPVIEKIIKQEKVPNDFKYLAVIESALLEKAISPVGAQGFWQFMPFTAKEYHLEISPEVDERLDVEKSTHAACKYLKQANLQFNDWLLAAASYNRGMGGVTTDLHWQKASNYFDLEQNQETGRYVYRILALKIILENQLAYGFSIPDSQKYTTIQTKKHVISSSILNLSDWAIGKGYNYKILKKLNPWLLKTHLTIKNKKYTLLLPESNEKIRPYSYYH
jgi:membrane-bound lytic murein transglycosylase D